MSLVLRWFVVTLCVIAAAPRSSAHTPVEFLEVFRVDPATEVEHAVDLQGTYDDRRISTMLHGPEFIGLSVGCLNRSAKQTKAYLNGYRIAEPVEQPQRTVSVLDMVRGPENLELEIGSAKYFLSPAQRVTTGTPDPVPTGLDQYLAFQVIAPQSVTMDVTLTESEQVAERKVLQPRFVCVAVEEWHHDEHFQVTHPRACFVVYQLDRQASDAKISTIDQFGLNLLQTKVSDQLCVRGSLLDSGAK